MRKVGTTEYAEILFELTSGKSDADIQKAIKVFTGYLAKQKALGSAGDIQTAYERLIDSREGRVRVTLATPEKLDSKTTIEIQEAMQKTFEASSIELQEKIDASLI